MTLFSYKAIDGQGRLFKGELDAVNPVDLELRLSHMGLDMVTGKPKSESRLPVIGWRKIQRRELIHFCFHLEQLIRAGVPILEGLADLRDSLDHVGFRGAVANLIEEIEGGMQLSEAMAAHPNVFDKLFVHLIKAGEYSGKLPEVLEQLTDSLKQQDELIAQTKKILIYPAIVGTVVTGAVVFLMVYLVPKLTDFIKSMGQTLPEHTQLLIAISHLFVNYWALLLVIPIGLFVTTKLLSRYSPNWQFIIDGYKLKLPLIGNLLRKIMLARFAHYFAIMYASGISILECIRISEGVVNNVAIAAGLARVRQQINEGLSLTASFQNVGLFPPLVLRMLRIGENSGQLDTALQNISYFYHRDVKESIERLQVVIEPAIILLLGGLLLWVALAVIGPIYDLMTKIQL